DKPRHRRSALTPGNCANDNALEVLLGHKAASGVRARVARSCCYGYRTAEAVPARGSAPRPLAASVSEQIESEAQTLRRSTAPTRRSRPSAMRRRVARSRSIASLRVSVTAQVIGLPRPGLYSGAFFQI